jgi:hypothetical protein
VTTNLIEDVGDDSYVATLKDITLTPAFPPPGRELRLDLVAELAEQVDLTAVQCQLQVKLGVITLYRKTISLPDMLAIWGAKLSGNTKAPAGEWKQNWTFSLPREIPKGDFRVYLEMFTRDDKDFLGLRAHVDFRKPPSAG